MRFFLSTLLTSTCALAFSDGFAPIDYAPMEEIIADSHLLTLAPDNANAVAEKEWFPGDASEKLGTDPTATPTPNASNIPNTGKGIFPTDPNESGLNMDNGTLPMEPNQSSPDMGKGIFPADPNEGSPYLPQPEMPSSTPAASTKAASGGAAPQS